MPPILSADTDNDPLRGSNVPADDGCATAAFHPGNVATSFGTRSVTWVLKFNTTNRPTRYLPILPRSKGPWLAESRSGVDRETGAYYEKRRPARRTNSPASEADLARRLWDRTTALLARLQHSTRSSTHHTTDSPATDHLRRGRTPDTSATADTVELPGGRPAVPAGAAVSPFTKRDVR
ncbi:hypothetical protein [Streptomyces shenzhenensis]|uniref:hypothetical protein n=1 Tax=Streptomyces shenzhenensis TaxID=943815 RepID=UPI003D93AB3E